MKVHEKFDQKIGINRNSHFRQFVRAEFALQTLKVPLNLDEIVESTGDFPWK
jgi:hypothetical protein